MPSLKELQHEYDSPLGLWRIDRNPAEVGFLHAGSTRDFSRFSRRQLGHFAGCSRT
jgi:hypothetical protein